MTRIAWAPIVLAWLFVGLVWREPWKADEGYSFGLVYSMLADGQWLVPTLAGEPFLEKPPLVYWLAALAAQAFAGPLALHEAARMANVLIVLATAAVLARAAAEALGRDRALPAVLWLAASPLWLVASKYLTADLGVVLAAALATLGLARWCRGASGAGAWMGMSALVGLMSKGLLMPGVLAVTVLLLLGLRRDLRTPGALRPLLLAGLLAGLGSAVWPVMLWRHDPGHFDTWFWVNNVGRFVGSNGLGPPNARLETLGAAVLGFLPAWPAAIAALRQRADLRAPMIGPAALVVVWVAAVAASATARLVYLLPVVAPLAFLAAAWRPRPDPRRHAAIGRRLVLAGLGAAGVAVGVRAGLIATGAGSPWGAAEAFSMPLAAVACVVAIGLWRLARGGELVRPLAAWVASMTFAWSAVMALFLGPADLATGFRGVLTALGRQLPPGPGCVASLGLGESERAMLHYYAGAKTVRVEVDAAAASGCAVRVEQQRFAGNGVPDGNPGFGCPDMILAWEGRRPDDRRGVFRICVASAALARATPH